MCSIDNTDRNTKYCVYNFRLYTDNDNRSITFRNIFVRFRHKCMCWKYYIYQGLCSVHGSYLVCIVEMSNYTLKIANDGNLLRCDISVHPLLETYWTMKHSKYNYQAIVKCRDIYLAHVTSRCTTQVVKCS
jgi:hypothetical protein